ncbi:MAG: chemotaxis protein CheA [Candidatus Nanohaloarchaea archaeon]
MSDINENMIGMYIEEANENIKQLNDGMLEYEDSENEEALNAMFRASHTLKSSSASMGFDTISELAHTMEDVFDKLQDNDLDTWPGLFDLLYTSIDTLEEMVDEVEEKEEKPEKDVSDLMEKLEKAKEGEKVELDEDDQDTEDEFEGVSEIKVDVDRLDTLMNLAGELLITEKKLRRLSQKNELDDFNSALDQLKRLGEDIRNEISEARMIPVSQIFDRFPRTVRDLSRRTEKEIDFNIEGGELRMDRTIIEELGEPIIHILRNAVDHGIEKPGERVEKGKPREGQITLKAEREGNAAIISVEDDGRGIDTDEVVEKAVENGVLKEDHNELSRQEKLNLLFDSGMSTNEEVTDLSGRGVGLNVVKNTAEELHGSYDISTEEDEGTRIEMKLPLSLAVVRCFLVQVGDNRYGIPINTILRVLEYSEIEVKRLENSRVFAYEEEEIPIIDLGRELGEGSSGEEEVIVVESGNQRAGLLVDDILDVEDFVSKDLDLLQVEGVAGVSMLSDGNPVLILDFSEIIGG